MTVNFAYRDAGLSEASKQQLLRNAEILKTKKTLVVEIEGHCDNRASSELNLKLSQRRAESVRKFLMEQGVPAKRLALIAYGKEHPLAPGDSEEAHARNRRANFLVLSN